MRAVVYTGPGRVRVTDVARPHPREVDDAIVRVELAAICGSDLHVLDGKTPGMRAGGVIGHEFIGVIDEAGDDVDARVGERVIGSFLIACGRCDACTAGRYNFCRERRALGLGTLTGDLEGAQAEYVRVPHADVNLRSLAAYAGLSDEKALFAGDILATAAHGAHLAAATPSDVVVIFGAGPVGLLTAMSLGRRAGPTFVLDPDPQRVEAARGILDHAEAVPLGSDPADELIAELAEGRLADVAIEAVGAVPAFKGALRAVRDGGRVVVLGVYGAERYELPMGRVWSRGLEIRFAGMTPVQSHWDEALEAVAAGHLDPTKLITHRLSLEEAAKGYELFRSREALKVTLVP